MLFSTEFAQLPSPSSPSHALVPTKQSRPEHGTARILPFEIGRKILLAQTKNLLLFLHSGSYTELLLQSRRRGGLTDCARSLTAAAALSQNSTRSRRASRSHNVLLFSSSLSLALSCEEGSFGGDAAVKRICCQCVNQIAIIAQIGNTSSTFARRFVYHFYHSAFSLTQSLFLSLSLSPSALALLLPLPALLPFLIMQSAAARFFFTKNTLS